MAENNDNGAGGAGAGTVDASLLTGGAPAGGGAGTNDGAGKPQDGGAPDWFSGLATDNGDTSRPSDQDWAKTKGFADLNALVASYRNLETAMGGDKVPVPKSADDAEGWNRFYKAAGRPDTPDGYSFDGITEADPNLLKSFAAEAHKLGLSANQAKAVAAYQVSLVQQQAQQIAERDRTESGQLQVQLGAEAQARINRAVQAGVATGLTVEQLGAIRQAVGPAAMFKLLDTAARAMGEDTFKGLNNSAGGKTMDQLAARKAEIKNNPELAKKLRAGDPVLSQEWAAIAEAEAQARKQQRAA